MSSSCFLLRRQSGFKHPVGSQVPAIQHLWLLARSVQGSKNLFCASRRIFRTEPGRHFSGRIFFHLGRSRAPRLKSLGAKEKAVFEASVCTHPNTNIINKMIANFFFRWKLMENKQKKNQKEDAPILMKPGEEGVGVVEWTQINRLQVEQKEKKETKETERKNAPTCVNILYHGRLK